MEQSDIVQEEETNPETRESLWNKVKTEDSYSGYRNYLEKYPNDTEALNNIFKNEEFKARYGSFLDFFQSIKTTESDFTSYFAFFSKNSCKMNNETVDYPYSENHYKKYQHDKLCSEAKIMEFPGIDSQGTAVLIEDDGISWLFQAVGAGVSSIINIEWKFEHENLVIVSSFSIASTFFII